MRLAGDHIDLGLGVEFITLRPTLRCGLRLERRDGSFAKLIADLQEGSLSAARFVIGDAFHHPAAGQCILDAGIDEVCAKLIAFVLNCAGIDPDAPQSTASGDEASEVTFGEHRAQLYRIATGWLGWTPDVALDATPVEIMEAYKGRLDMLKAVFGGGDEDESAKPAKKPQSADHFKAVFRDLGAKQVKRAA